MYIIIISIHRVLPIINDPYKTFFLNQISGDVYNKLIYFYVCLNHKNVIIPTYSLKMIYLNYFTTYVNPIDCKI